MALKEIYDGIEKGLARPLLGVPESNVPGWRVLCATPSRLPSCDTEGGGRCYSALNLFRSSMIDRLPCQPGDVERTFADIGLARAELGFEPRTNLDTGLRTFVEWLRGSGKAR